MNESVVWGLLIGLPATLLTWECILIQQDDGTVCHRSVVGGDDCDAVG